MSGVEKRLKDGNVLIAGAEYKVVECKKGVVGCDVCDAQYSNNWCRVGGALCYLKRNQCYKVADDRKMIKANNVYGNTSRYISSKGRCEDCNFFQKNGCNLYGMACKGYTPLKPMPDKGGI